jgi:ABC-2 type transport system ATP-binding protein
VIALGSPAELKQRYSGEAIVITPDVPAPSLPALALDLAGALAGDPPAAGAAPGAAWAVTGDGAIRLALADGSPGATEAMAAAFALLARRGVAVLAAGIARPSLDDVFLHETGRTLRDAGSPPGGARPDGAAGVSAAAAGVAA